MNALPCDLCPSPIRDNAWSLQPRSGPDHPCLCLPGSDGGPVLFCGAAYKGQEQTQAQETSHQTTYISPAAADDDWEKPHCLTGTAALLLLLETVERTTWKTTLEAWFYLESDELPINIRLFLNYILPGVNRLHLQASLWCWKFCASCLFTAVCGCLCAFVDQ